MAYAQSHPSDSSLMALQTSATLEKKEINSMVLLRPTWHCLSSEYPFLVHASVPRFANYFISICRSAWLFLRSHFRPDIGCFIEVLHYSCSLWEMSNIFIGLWTPNAIVQNSIQNYLFCSDQQFNPRMYLNLVSITAGAMHRFLFVFLKSCNCRMISVIKHDRIWVLAIEGL